MKPILFIVLTGALWTSCNNQIVNSPETVITDASTKVMTADNISDLKIVLENGAILLDVRTLEEYQEGHTKNAINIPLDSLGNNLSKLDKNKSIITVCRSGVRSKNAANLLKYNGYNNVYDGGSWTNFK